jgi:hypothetical protein
MISLQFGKPGFKAAIFLGDRGPPPSPQIVILALISFSPDEPDRRLCETQS